MTKQDNLAEIGILLYPTALLSAVHGLTELFYVANIHMKKHENAQLPTMRVSHWQQSEKTGKIEKIFDTHPDFANAPVAIIAPPSINEPMSSEAARPFAKWLHEHHDNGAILSSVCAGSFLIAETGLLKGRSATTHWVYADEMTRSFPDIKVDGDKLIIDDGDIITSGGMMSWTDLGLRLVHRLLGPTIMLETSRFMLVDPPGREQRYYSSFIPKLHHGDQQILKVQHWLQANGAKEVNLPAMAKQAGLEERTFLRRFQKATGMKPTEYCQYLRIGRAREMLEFTQQNIAQIAWATGYEDPGSFRKVFQKIMGLSPGDYRTRFGNLQAA